MVLLEEIEGFKKKLKCPICNSAEKDAILTKCFHVFCYHCLKTRYETRTGSFLTKNLFSLKIDYFLFENDLVWRIFATNYITIYALDDAVFSEFARMVIMSI